MIHFQWYFVAGTLWDVDVHLELGTPGGWHPLFARQGKAERKQNTGKKIKSSSRNLEIWKRRDVLNQKNQEQGTREIYGACVFIFDNQDLGGMGYLI